LAKRALKEKHFRKGLSRIDLGRRDELTKRLCLLQN
jgi:hypothetical protein